MQLAYEGGLTSIEEGQPFGRVPPFTLYADGRMIWVPFTAPRRVLEATLSAADIAAVLQQVYDRGFGHLESYTSQCRLDNAGNGECTADAGMSILRARMPDGTLREVRNYADYANDVTALRAIRERLSFFAYPTAAAYRPSRATLFLGPLHGDPASVTLVPWPLAAEVLTPPRPEVASWARVLTGAEYATLVAASGTPLGDVYVEHQGKRYSAYVVPWLPDVDYTAQVAAYDDPLPSATAPARSGMSTGAGQASTATTVVSNQAFWDALKLHGEEAEHYASLQGMAAQADAVVVGTFASFEHSRQIVGDAAGDIVTYAAATLVVAHCRAGHHGPDCRRSHGRRRCSGRATAWGDRR